MEESSTPPTQGEHSAGGTGSDDPAEEQISRPALDGERAAVEIARGKLGAEPRREKREERDARRAPVTKEDLTRGPEDLTRDRREEREPQRQVDPVRAVEEPGPHRGPRVNWVVFLTSSAIILAFSLWTILAPPARLPTRCCRSSPGSRPTSAGSTCSP